ncbi:MAG: membrane protein insertion efficiency factor YidD [Desulfomonile sp.]|nr:membrane protein insertion efficiency factor YidD [Desulfomonile sp.]
MTVGRYALSGAIRLYQILISPLFPSSCRFYPTCSEYAREAVLEHGVGKGLLLTLRRLGRCRPFGPGGFDPVP